MAQSGGRSRAAGFQPMSSATPAIPSPSPVTFRSVSGSFSATAAISAANSGLVDTRITV